jgi:adenosylmethionine-8-amino-7-oxononanoate aminotransferase
MEIAIKLAFQYWQQQGRQFRRKKKFLAFDMAYHGDSLGTVSLSGISLFHKTYKPLLFKTFRADPPYCYRCPLQLRYPSCRLACIQPIEATLKAHHREIAALVIEPMIQGVGGMITSPPGYLKAIRELCTRYDVLLIADEVATGFGRTGKMFACDHEGVTPDVMAVSKGLTGGYMPLAATLTTQRIYDGFLGPYDAFRTFFHGHSYTGNPLGCAVALANLKIFKRTRILKALPEKVRAFQAVLRSLKPLTHVGQIRQLGFMVGIELVRNKRTKEPYRLEDRIGHKVAMEARRQHLMIRPIGNIIVLMPPVTATSRELKVMVEAVRLAIQSVTRSRRCVP